MNRYRALLQLSCLAAVSLTACWPRQAVSTDTTTESSTTTDGGVWTAGTSESESESDGGSESTTTGDGDGDGDWTPPGDTDEPHDCDCEPDEMCVASSEGCDDFDGVAASASCVVRPPSCTGSWTCAPDDPCPREVCGPWRDCVGDCGQVIDEDITCAQPRPCDHIKIPGCTDEEKCAPYSYAFSWRWQGRVCLPILGDDPVGTPCMRGDPVFSDSCDASSVCWNAVVLDVPVMGTCRELCDSEGGFACPVDARCARVTDDLGVCLASCDPLGSNCAAGQICAWLRGDFVCLEHPPSPIAPGEPCGFVNDCGPDTICLQAEGHPACNGASCCAAYCDVNGPDTCAPGTVCQPFLPDGRATPEQAGIGVCAVPELQPSIASYPEHVAHRGQ